MNDGLYAPVIGMPLRHRPHNEAENYLWPTSTAIKSGLNEHETDYSELTALVVTESSKLVLSQQVLIRHLADAYEKLEQERDFWKNKAQNPS
ncbi:MAG: hypothetical protein EBT34_06740 [Acetobacteraceae bacterium]|nr:hypothetical protein [Acetobacteraceae bacterium]